MDVGVILKNLVTCLTCAINKRLIKLPLIFADYGLKEFKNHQSGVPVFKPGGEKDGDDDYNEFSDDMSGAEYEYVFLKISLYQQVKK